MEQILENNAARLLDDVAGIIKRYEAQWQKTGEKYNIFKVAGITHKEVIMCRVLADLLDPQGKHCQGSRYLSLFWETISPKLPGLLELSFKDTKVTAEYAIDENRRIDITLEDGRIFVPIEVKIGAPDLSKQVADYFAFAKTKTGTTMSRCFTSLLTAMNHQIFQKPVSARTAMCCSRSGTIFSSGLRRVQKIHRKQLFPYGKILNNSSRR